MNILKLFLFKLRARLKFVRSSEGWMWALPTLVLGLFVIALFALLLVLHKQEKDLQRNALVRDIQWAEQTIRTHLMSNQDFLVQLAQEVADGSMNEEAFQIRASQYIANNPELTHILFLDPKRTILWTAPFETTSWNTGESLAYPEQILSFKRAVDLGLPTYSLPQPLPEGGSAIAIHVPGTRHHILKGMVVGVYEADHLLRYLAPSWFSEKYHLVLENKERVISTNASVAPKTVLSDIVRLDPPGQGLQLRVSAFSAESNVPRNMIVLLIAGLVIVMAWSLWALGAHMRRRFKAEQERDRLFQLVHQEYSFRKAMEESVMTGLRAIDMSGQIMYVNPAFCEMVGWTEAELVGRMPPFPYWPEESIDTLLHYSALTLRGEAPPSGLEVRIKRKTGEYVYTRMYSSPLIDADGQQTGWMSALVDITDLKRAEELGLQQQKRLEQTSRLVSMGEMASSLAHELNQPLAAIANYCMGCVNRLQAAHMPHTQDEKRQREELLIVMEKASAQAQRAGKIIRSLRDFVRKREPNRSSVGLKEIIDEVLAFAEIEARKANVKIQYHIPHNLHALFADKVMIEQVLLNLVKNGIEAMHNTPPENRQLDVSAYINDSHMVEVAVADHGHGISPEQAEHLFTPFYTTKPEGMGMGLKICRSIIEFHHGRLWVSPNALGGSVFHFTLPSDNQTIQTI